MAARIVFTPLCPECSRPGLIVEEDGYLRCSQEGCTYRGVTAMLNIDEVPSVAEFFRLGASRSYSVAGLDLEEWLAARQEGAATPDGGHAPEPVQSLPSDPRGRYEDPSNYEYEFYPETPTAPADGSTARPGEHEEGRSSS